uniref:Uncharacterized protein n=1 Tax=Sphenodon punctatus TaxID=8508 RepID=A0A8D0L1B9_SPHPU
MFRRARFSVKPNVRPGAQGRGGGSDPAAPAAEPQRDLDPSCSISPAAASAECQPGAPAPSEPQPGGNRCRDEKAGEADDDGGSSKPADAPLQRRKRISTMPNLAKPRVSLPSARHCVSSVSKSPQKQVPQSPANCNSSLQKESSPSEKTHIESSPKSPILPEKKTPVPQVPQFSPFKKSISKDTNVCLASNKGDEILQKNMPCPLKERPTQGRLIQEEITLPKPTSVTGKQISSDRERILKAQKLRLMLKEELKKERVT